MIEHPNSLLLHHCLQAASVGDRQTLRALWADDIVWHVKGTGQFQGEIKGADDIFEYLAELGEFGDAGFHTEVDDVMVSHHRAAVICQSHVPGSHAVPEAGYLLIANIADRRIQSMVTVPLDGDRLETFYAD